MYWCKNTRMYWEKCWWLCKLCQKPQAYQWNMYTKNQRLHWIHKKRRIIPLLKMRPHIRPFQRRMHLLIMENLPLEIMSSTIQTKQGKIYLPNSQLPIFIRTRMYRMQRWLWFEQKWWMHYQTNPRLSRLHQLDRM